MLVGHIAVGMLGKRAEPRLSLGLLVFAAMLADILWTGLLYAGIERFDPVPGAALNRVVGRHIVWSHSLLMGAVWGALLAAAFFWRRRYARGAWILLAAAVSHWALDVASHRPDMPIAPGLPWVLGFGLWNSMPATLLVEGGLWLTAIVLYRHAYRPKNRAAVPGLWGGIVLLTLIWRQNIAAGVDPDPRRAAIGGMVFFLLIVAWAWWMERAHIRSL